jgi:hypothetical protein
VAKAETAVTLRPINVSALALRADSV